MSQPTKFSSTPSTLAGTKAGNEGGSPSTSRRAVSIAIAIEGEGGLAFVQKMMAQGGPARPGEGESRRLLPFFRVLIYIHPQQLSHT